MKHIYLLFTAFSFFAAQIVCANNPMAETPMDPMEEAPMYMELADEQEGQDIEVNEITITFDNAQVQISNASGKNLEIYNLTGVRVATFRIDSDDKTLNLNLPKGCYILKVGKVVRKVSIR